MLGGPSPIYPPVHLFVNSHPLFQLISCLRHIGKINPSEEIGDSKYYIYVLYCVLYCVTIYRFIYYYICRLYIQIIYYIIYMQSKGLETQKNRYQASIITPRHYVNHHTTTLQYSIQQPSSTKKIRRQLVQHELFKKVLFNTVTNRIEKKFSLFSKLLIR